MPIGTFLPFDETDKSPRFFARPISFEMECPQCGRLLLVGPNRRDSADYNRVTGMVTCRPNVRKGTVGCGRRWLIGIVAWGIVSGPKKARPADQRPNGRQLAELRQAARGVWPRVLKRRGAQINQIEPDQEREIANDTDS